MFFLIAAKPAIGDDYTYLTSFKIMDNDSPGLSSEFRCKVLETSVRSLSNGRDTVKWAGFESWPDPTDTAEIKLSFYIDTQMFFVKNAFQTYVAKLDKGWNFMYLVDHERIQIGGDGSWIEPDEMSLSMQNGILTFSRYHKRDFNVAYTLASVSNRDIYVGHAFMDCRAENFIIEDLFTILKQHPNLLLHKN